MLTNRIRAGDARDAKLTRMGRCEGIVQRGQARWMRSGCWMYRRRAVVAEHAATGRAHLKVNKVISYSGNESDKPGERCI